MKMNKYVKTGLTALAVGGAFLSNFVQAETLKLEYKNGQMMCFVSSSRIPNSDDKLQKYFSGIDPIITAENIEFQGTFGVEKVLSGQHRVPYVGIIKMPSRQSKININEKRLSEWQHIRETRHEIWEELRLADFEMSENKSFVFDTEKYYQLDAYWVKTDKDDEFETHITKEFKKAKHLGGKIVHQFAAPFKYETMGMERAPDVYTIVEWDSKESFDKYWQQKGDFKYLAGHDAWLTKLLPPRKSS